MTLPGMILHCNDGAESALVGSRSTMRPVDLWRRKRSSVRYGRNHHLTGLTSRRTRKGIFAMTNNSCFTYAEATLADPEEFPSWKASASVPAADFPITIALCATSDSSWEWVPQREANIVPAGMAAMCQACPGRIQCLLWAMGTNSYGYWAGSTRADRDELLRRRSVSIEAVDELQRDYRGSEAAKHHLGQGSQRWYRKGCRCHECRAVNAARVNRNRARSK